MTLLDLGVAAAELFGEYFVSRHVGSRQKTFDSQDMSA